jgi:hydrogenase maturation protease
MDEMLNAAGLPNKSLNTKIDTLIIGSGNLLRGDDAVGPVLIRHLWEMGLPDDVNCADGGTGGMDVAFQMRGVRHVILVDACVSGSEPGALFCLPGEETEHLPPLAGINLHAFRWDHALSFARWLLKEDYPKKITVYLIEAKELVIGEPLSAPVDAAMRRLARTLLAELAQRPPHREQVLAGCAYAD